MQNLGEILALVQQIPEIVGAVGTAFVMFLIALRPLFAVLRQLSKFTSTQWDDKLVRVIQVAMDKTFNFMMTFSGINKAIEKRERNDSDG